MMTLNLPLSLFSIALVFATSGCAPIVQQPSSSTIQTATGSRGTANSLPSQSKTGSQRSQTPALPQQSANAKSRNVPENWQAIGPVMAPGCGGIEVVEYFEKRIYGPERMYYIGVRNNNSVAKVVFIDYRGGVRVNGSRGEGTKNTTVAAGEIKQIEIDMSQNIPRRVQVARCL